MESDVRAIIPPGSTLGPRFQEGKAAPGRKLERGCDLAIAEAGHLPFPLPYSLPSFFATLRPKLNNGCKKGLQNIYMYITQTL